MFILTATILSAVVLPAKEAPPRIKKEKAQLEKESQKNRFMATPFLFYTTETTLGAGAAASYIFQLGPSQSTHPSSITPFAIYTLKQQFRCLLGSNFYFKDNRFHLVSELRFEKYPSKFFGIGNENHHQEGEDYTPENLNFVARFSRQIKRQFEIGLIYHFYHWNLTDVSEQGKLSSEDIAGRNGGTVSGLGVAASLDSRDHIFFPSRGYLIEIQAQTYAPFMGSSFTYQSFSLNIRRYFKVFNHHVVALQSLVKAQSGVVPFCQLAQMGGEFYLRGYYEGRYRDKNLLLFQGEYRLPLFWRIGMVGFLGLGNVANRLDRLSLQQMNLAWGFGLRYLLDKKGKIQLRVDLGFGHDSTGFYISFYEAF